MKKTDLAYMAGFFDGEGWITISEKDLRCGVAQANEWIINLFKFRFGGRIYTRDPKNHKGHLGKRFIWDWRIDSRQAALFLEAIKPYLILKLAEAQIAIEYQANKTYRQIHRKGRPPGMTDKEKAIAEAQRILLHNLKDKSRVV